jgi:hypothetical protein
MCLRTARARGTAAVYGLGPTLRRREFFNERLSGDPSQWFGRGNHGISSHLVISDTRSDLHFPTFIFTPAVCFNIVFHAGATAVFGVYCPGLLTALTLYPPLFYVVSRLAFREHLLTNRLALVSFAIAGAFHTADVSHNVFKLW